MLRFLTFMSFVCLHGQVGATEFGAPALYAVGSVPQALAVADFNGDRRPDLAAANWADDTVSILLGDGFGGFVAAPVVPVGEGPTNLTTGDVDGDGTIDLLVLDTESYAVVTRLGDGGGGFVDGPTLSLVNRPRALVTAEINGDEYLDLVVSLDGSGFMANGTVEVFHGAGGGQFAPVEEHDVASTSAHLVLVDVNTDGVLDLLSANPSFGGPVQGGLTVFLGDGLGGFVLETLILGQMEYLAVADYDEDGFLDVATTLAEDFVCAPTYNVLFGNGTGSFPSLVEYEVGCFTSFVVSADFDLDGNADLAFTDVTVQQLLVLEGDGDGLFAAPLGLDLGLPWAPVVSDFDGDGDSDLASLSVDSESVAVFLNESNPTLIRGDCNSSGVTDISDPLFLLLFLFASGLGPVCEDACDVDDGGVLDLADAVYLLAALFSGGPPPVEPALTCGVDPTTDGLVCGAAPACP